MPVVGWDCVSLLHFVLEKQYSSLASNWIPVSSYDGFKVRGLSTRGWAHRLDSMCLMTGSPLLCVCCRMWSFDWIKSVHRWTHTLVQVHTCKDKHIQTHAQKSHHEMHTQTHGRLQTDIDTHLCADTCMPTDKLYADTHKHRGKVPTVWMWCAWVAATSGLWLWVRGGLRVCVLPPQRRDTKKGCVWEKRHGTIRWGGEEVQEKGGRDRE